MYIYIYIVYDHDNETILTLYYIYKTHTLTLYTHLRLNELKGGFYLCVDVYYKLTHTHTHLQFVDMVR